MGQKAKIKKIKKNNEEREYVGPTPNEIGPRQQGEREREIDVTCWRILTYNRKDTWWCPLVDVWAPHPLLCITGQFLTDFVGQRKLCVWAWAHIITPPLAHFDSTFFSHSQQLSLLSVRVCGISGSNATLCFSIKK